MERHSYLSWCWSSLALKMAKCFCSSCVWMREAGTHGSPKCYFSPFTPPAPLRRWEEKWGNDSFSSLAWFQPQWQMHGFYPKRDEREGLAFGRRPESLLEWGRSATVPGLWGNDHRFYFAKGRSLIARAGGPGEVHSSLPFCSAVLN